ncbi:MAG TPA: hypothetical protein VKB19_20070 [Pedobacter sp.]|nr:hypothetical protein [Pedobacter sp.]
MGNYNEKEVGSNLTGTAVPAKPGHQRDIPVDQYIGTEELTDSSSPKHIENTDALLADVEPDRDESE